MKDFRNSTIVTEREGNVITHEIFFFVNSEGPVLSTALIPLGG